MLVTCDDPSGISSTNEEDARFIARLADLPLLEPSTPAEALLMMRFAFELSEKIRNLVVFRSLSRLSHTRAGIIPGPLNLKRPKPFWDPKQNYYTLPVVPLHKRMHDKLAQAAKIMAASGFNSYTGPEKPEVLIIASGSSVLYAAEAVELLGAGDKAGILKLACTWPLPEELALEHISRTEKVLFAEEVDPFIENEVKALYAQHAGELGLKAFFGKVSGHTPAVSELSPGIMAKAISEVLGLKPPAADREYQEKLRQKVDALVTSRELGFCPGCPHRASLWSIKQTLAVDGRRGLVSGDIGCYTLGVLPTGFSRVNSVHCMGSGLGISSGLGQLKSLGFDQPVVSIVGDSTFFHAALPAVVNARWNQSDYVLVVLDNSATAMTGFQPHPGTGETATGREGTRVDVESVCRALDLPCQVVDPYDLAATQEALYDALQQGGGLRVLIFRRVCSLVQGKRGGHPYVMSVDHDLCRGDACGCNRFCSRVFRCPGLVFDEKTKKAHIDEVVCVGCGVCARICPSGAIKAEPKKEAAA